MSILRQSLSEEITHLLDKYDSGNSYRRRSKNHAEHTSGCSYRSRKHHADSQRRSFSYSNGDSLCDSYDGETPPVTVGLKLYIERQNAKENRSKYLNSRSKLLQPNSHKAQAERITSPNININNDCVGNLISSNLCNPKLSTVNKGQLNTHQKFSRREMISPGTKQTLSNFHGGSNEKSNGRNIEPDLYVNRRIDSKGVTNLSRGFHPFSEKTRPTSKYLNPERVTGIQDPAPIVRGTEGKSFTTSNSSYKWATDHQRCCNPCIPFLAGRTKIYSKDPLAGLKKDIDHTDKHPETFDLGSQQPAPIIPKGDLYENINLIPQTILHADCSNMENLPFMKHKSPLPLNKNNSDKNPPLVWSLRRPSELQRYRSAMPLPSDSSSVITEYQFKPNSTSTPKKDSHVSRLPPNYIYISGRYSGKPVINFSPCTCFPLNPKHPRFTALYPKEEPEYSEILNTYDRFPHAYDRKRRPKRDEDYNDRVNHDEDFCPEISNTNEQVSHLYESINKPTQGHLGQSLEPKTENKSYENYPSENRHGMILPTYSDKPKDGNYAGSLDHLPNQDILFQKNAPGYTTCSREGGTSSHLDRKAPDKYFSSRNNIVSNNQPMGQTRNYEGMSHVGKYNPQKTTRDLGYSRRLSSMESEGLYESIDVQGRRYPSVNSPNYKKRIEKNHTVEFEPGLCPDTAVDSLRHLKLSMRYGNHEPSLHPNTTINCRKYSPSLGKRYGSHEPSFSPDTTVDSRKYSGRRCGSLEPIFCPETKVDSWKYSGKRYGNLDPNFCPETKVDSWKYSGKRYGNLDPNFCPETKVDSWKYSGKRYGNLDPNFCPDTKVDSWKYLPPPGTDYMNRGLESSNVEEIVPRDNQDDELNKSVLKTLKPDGLDWSEVRSRPDMLLRGALNHSTILTPTWTRENIYYRRLLPDTITRRYSSRQWCQNLGD